MIQYRRLEKHELTPEMFQDFIRHQTVQDCYRKREGRWVIEPALLLMTGAGRNTIFWCSA